jgi:hypothetical protein
MAMSGEARFGDAAESRADGLFAVVYDLLRRHGHRPGLHLVREMDADGHRRAWLSAAGFGALGHSIEHAARLYVQAGGSLATDPELREELRRIGRMLTV